MRPILALLLAATIGAVGFYAGRATAPDSGRTAAPRTDRNPREPGRQDEMERLETQLAAKRGELAEARDRIEALENEPRRESDRPAKTAPAPDVTDPRFTFEGQADALREVDWKVVGEAMANLQPVLGKIAAAIEDGRDVTTMTEEVGSAQRWNGPLVTQALKLRNSGLSGTATNGAFTHPSVIVNQVHATLREAGQPLTEQQERALGDLGTRYIEAEARRVAAYDDSTVRAKETLEEALLKERLYDEIDAMLTPAQLEALHPERIRGIMKADLFSSGLIWLQVAQPMSFTDRAGLAAQIAPSFMRDAKLPDQQADTVRAIVTEWVDALPDAFLARPQTKTVASGFLPVADIIDAARREIELRERLIRALPDDDARDRVRRGLRVIVPYRRAG